MYAVLNLDVGHALVGELTGLMLGLQPQPATKLSIAVWLSDIGTLYVNSNPTPGVILESRWNSGVLNFDWSLKTIIKLGTPEEHRFEFSLRGTAIVTWTSTASIPLGSTHFFVFDVDLTARTVTYVPRCFPPSPFLTILELSPILLVSIVMAFYLKRYLEQVLQKSLFKRGRQPFELEILVLMQ